MDRKKASAASRAILDLERPYGRYVMDIDIGGTYADAIVSRKNLLKFYKVSTTPHDLSDCLKEFLLHASRDLELPDPKALLTQTEVIRLSTSLSTNLIVEEKGARCGLLLSKGWKQKHLSQLSSKNDGFTVFHSDLVCEICSPINEEEVISYSRFLLEQGVRFIVISLADGDVSPGLEKQVKGIIRRNYPRHCIGVVPVLLGSQMSTGSDYRRRTNTALFNTCCHEAISMQFFRIEDLLRKEGYIRPLLIVKSDGGASRIAKTSALKTLNSGAAAGVYGVSRLAETYGHADLISVDVGGTSTEIGMLRRGVIVNTQPAEMNGFPLDMSFPVLSTLGVGGGSIARVDRHGNLVLGPQSAGAFPGPACYNLGGTEPTLTDAYLILGYLDENYYLGGRKKLDINSARKAMLEKIGTPLAMSCEDAAYRIKCKAVEIIGEQILAVLRRNGSHPPEFPLFALGGGGGCMGADLAEYSGIPMTRVFRQGPVFGAFGSSCMNIIHSFECRTSLSLFGQSKEEVCRKLNECVVPLQLKASKDIRSEGFPAEETRFELELELELPNADSPVSIHLNTPFFWPPRDWPLLMEQLEKRIGIQKKHHKSMEVLVTRIVLKAMGILPRSESFTSADLPLNQKPVKTGRRIYTRNGSMVETRVYEWDLLTVPGVYDGPAIIESPDTTILVPEGRRIVFSKDYNGMIEALKR